jgi:cell wall-associated NlpC family hydrolase
MYDRPRPGPDALSTALQALAIAEQYLGTPFVAGGASPASGFDAAGLVQYAYGQVGITLPRAAAEQFALGTPVVLAALRAGDLVFFADVTGFVFHVGIYAGDGRFVHAPHRGDVVRLTSLETPFYAQQFAGGSRLAD